MYRDLYIRRMIRKKHDCDGDDDERPKSVAVMPWLVIAEHFLSICIIYELHLYGKSCSVTKLFDR